jgi:hypothetical protein
MNELTIERLTASAVASSDEQASTDIRLRGLLQRVAASRLDAAMAEVPLPQGYWCIRWLNVALTLNFDQSDATLETQWSRALVEAISTAIENQSDDVVCYPRMVDALKDLLVSVAQHRDDRDWAWRQVGLLTAADGGVRSDGGNAADVVLAALRRHPREAVAAITACVRRTGAAPLHRILGSSGWSSAARIALGALGVSASRALELFGYSVSGAMDPAGLAASASAGPASAPAASSGPAAAAGAASASAALIQDLLARSTLTDALRRLPVRIEPALARAWAVIVAAEAAPSLLLRADAGGVITAVAEHLAQAAAPARNGFLWGDDRVRPPRHGVPPDHRASSGAEEGGAGTHPPDGSVAAERLDIEDERDDAAGEQPATETLWAGLLFLLNTAAGAGIPGELLEDPGLRRLPLWRTMSEVLQRMLPVAADEPALLAMSGLQRYVVGQVLTEGEQACIGVHASRWAEVTTERMGETNQDPHDLCLRVALRRGTIVAEPGWIEVQLRLDDVDVDVRRAGLDLDPGWVPWLGSVVRFRYD